MGAASMTFPYYVSSLLLFLFSVPYVTSEEVELTYDTLFQLSKSHYTLFVVLFLSCAFNHSSLV